MGSHPDNGSAYKSGGEDSYNSAKQWVEKHFPHLKGQRKAETMLIYGAGFDAGIAETLRIIHEMKEKFTRP